MDAKLTEVGVEHDFITLKGVGHGLSAGAKPEELAEVTRRAVEFVESHTK